MENAPTGNNERVTVAFPPLRGPGSAREAWVQFAHTAADFNQTLWKELEERTNYIAHLEAEVARLRARLAERKPKGGRLRVPDRTVAAIRADLAAGLSQGQAAERNGVSAMTVSRLVKSSRPAD